MKTINLAIIGDYSLSDDYSNTKHLLLSLHKDPRFNIVLEYGESLLDQKCYLNKSFYKSILFLILRRLINGIKASFIISKTKSSDVDIIYIPYLSLLPLFFFHFSQE